MKKTKRQRAGNPTDSDELAGDMQRSDKSKEKQSAGAADQIARRSRTNHTTGAYFTGEIRAAGAAV